METPQVVICNTTPVINFVQIGLTDILRNLFGEILLPGAVTDELTAKAARFPLASAAWRHSPFVRREVLDSALLQNLKTTLHPGESECIALEAEYPGALLILDDLAARETALRSGCNVIGTLGCLLEARKAGILSEVAPALVALRRNARFWLSAEMESAVLRRAGEL